MRLRNLFKFPTVMVDGENEERKQSKMDMMGEGDMEYDILYGEAEYPYFDFIGVEDRWLPTKQSFEKAMDGRFEACGVRFMNVGERLVPWSKKKFKAELQRFIDELIEEERKTNAENKDETTVTMTAQDLQTLLAATVKKDE